MYTISFLKVGKWRAEKKSGGGFDGNLQEVTEYAKHYFDISLSEIDYAINDMIKNNHDSVEFGVFGKFLLSFDSEYKKFEDEGGMIHGLH